MTRLTYKTYSHAPGYRDLTLKLVDPATGKEYELDLRPADIQRVIFACADATKQIGTEPPIDWETWRAQIIWPHVIPWRVGPATAKVEGRP